MDFIVYICCDCLPSVPFPSFGLVHFILVFLKQPANQSIASLPSTEMSMLPKLNYPPGCTNFSKSGYVTQGGTIIDLLWDIFELEKLEKSPFLPGSKLAR